MEMNYNYFCKLNETRVMSCIFIKFMDKLRMPSDPDTEHG